MAENTTETSNTAPPAPPVAGAVLPPVQGAPPAPNAAPPAPPAPPAPKTVVPVAPLAVGDPEALKAAEVALQTEKEKLSQIDKYLEDGTKARVDQAKALDKAQALHDSLQPVKTNADAIQAYLAQQVATLAKRHEQNQGVIAAAKAAGLSVAQYLGSLMPGKRAPIDAAMARKNNRGTGRPGAVPK